MNDQIIVDKLRSKKRDKALLKLYTYYPKVEKLILSKGGSKLDAQDTFQEALIIFCQKVQNPAFQLTSSVHTYLYGICRLLWSNVLKSRKKQSTTDLPPELDTKEQEDLEAFLEKEEQVKLAMRVLEELGARCWELLKLFYYQSLKMKEIAQKMDFRSEKIARNQKYKCLERAKLKLKEKLA